MPRRWRWSPVPRGLEIGMRFGRWVGFGMMPGVESQGIGAQQPAHARHQIPVGGLNDQVKMIAHQTIRVNLKTGLRARLGQGLDKILPVHIRYSIGLAFSRRQK
jgi:hypothetical protein